MEEFIFLNLLLVRNLCVITDNFNKNVSEHLFLLNINNRNNFI